MNTIFVYRGKTEKKSGIIQKRVELAARHILDRCWIAVSNRD